MAWNPLVQSILLGVSHKYVQTEALTVLYKKLEEPEITPSLRKQKYATLGLGRFFLERLLR